MSKHIQRLSIYCLFLICFVLLGCPKEKKSVKPAPPPPPSFGYSVNGKPIENFIFNGGKKTGVLFIGSIHGDEAAGTNLLYRLNTQLKNNKSIYQSRTIVILPNVNPDGVIANSRENANNVDINHNFEGGIQEPETKAILNAIAYFQNEGVENLRIISIRQLNSIDYDGPKAKQLAKHMAKLCRLRLKKWGTTSGSLGWYGKANDIPVITFGLPNNRTLERRGLDPVAVWEKYKPALIGAIEFEFDSRNDDEPRPKVPQTSAENPEEFYNAGKAYLQKGEHDRAIRSFRKVIRLERHYKNVDKYLCQAYYQKGMKLLQDSQHLTAIKEFKAAERAQGNCENASERINECRAKYREIHYKQAKQYYNENKWNETIRSCNKILAVLPDDTEVTGLKEKASSDLRRNSNIQDLVNKGKKAFDRNQWEKAISAFEGVLNIDPGHNDAKALLKRSKQEYIKFHYNRGLSYFNNGDEENAVKEFQAVLEIEPDSTDALKMAEISTDRLEGKKLYKERKFDDAVQEFKAVLEKDRNDKVSQELLADCYFEIGKKAFDQEKYDEAGQAFKLSLKYNSASQKSRQYLAQTMQQRNQAIYNDAIVLIKSQKWDKALESLDNIDSPDASLSQKIRKSKNDVYLGQSKEFIHQRSWDDALESLDQISADYVNYQQVKILLNDIYYQKGNSLLSERKWDPAIEAFSNVTGNYKDTAAKLELARTNKKFDEVYQRALNHLNSGRCDEAVEAFKQIDPNFRESNQKLAEAKKNCYKLHFEEGDALFQRQQYLSAVDEFIIAWGYYNNRKASDPCRQKIEQCKTILYRNGLSHYEKNEWDKAILNFRKIYEIDPQYKNVKSKLNEIKSNLAAVVQIKKVEIQSLETKIHETPNDSSLQTALNRARVNLEEVKQLLSSLP